MLGTFGVALILVAIPITWRYVEFYVFIVRSSQALEMEWLKKAVGRPILGLVILSAPSWVAATMAFFLTHGSDPESLLLGAIVTNAVVAGYFRQERYFYLAILPVTVMSYILLHAGPLTQAGTLAFGSWLLLLAGVRVAATDVVQLWHEDWKRYSDLRAIAIPPRIWAPALFVVSLVALILGARWLLAWDYRLDNSTGVTAHGVGPCAALGRQQSGEDA